MRSRASIDGHPIHPALIPFPLAFLFGALIFDALGFVLDHSGLSRTGGHLAAAGIAAAVIAAVPGFIDYFKTVPPNSTGKQRATRHMLVNVAAVALFALALWLRGGFDGEPVVLSLAAQVGGAALLTAGGWMGGVLVNRNQIGVDHRYAGAGKWREERIDASDGEWVTAARANELEVDQMKLVHVNGERIVVARTDSGWAAFQDRCTHRGASLADGVLICGTVQCPWHGSQFDTDSGAVKAGPAEEGIRTYRVEQRGDEIRVSIRGR